MQQPRRRDVLTLGGLAAAGLALAGCGGGAPLPTAVQPRSPVKAYWARQRRHGTVNFANWPLYIDTGHKTLQEFTAATGITVNYSEVIQEVSDWVGKISPILRSGQSIGYDMMVVTNGFWFSELVSMGELVPLDQSMLVNFHKYAAPRFQHRSFDPGNTYSIPWASGTTGIAWNPKFIQEPVTSINALWNPAWKGRIGMISDIQDVGNFGLLKLGINPETSTPADWQAAAKVLTQQKHLVRGYYGQSYIDELVAGNTWISMAWSGDIFQQNLSSGTPAQVRHPGRGRHAVDRQHDDPQVRAEPDGRDAADGLVLPAADRGPADRVDQLHQRGAGRPAAHRRGRGQGHRQQQGAAARGGHQRAGLAVRRGLQAAVQLSRRERQGTGPV